MATKVKPTRLQITWVPQVGKVPTYVDKNTFAWWAGWGWWASFWRFLSLWDCATWMPISFPEATPYNYLTWDYYIVETVSSATPPVNYKPDWSSYTGTASSVTESDEVEIWDTYVYDWATWLLQSNHWKTVTFANIAGQPTDNTNLATALGNKLDTSALSNNNYWGSWQNDSTHAATKWALYTKIHTMDVEIGNKAADNTVVKLTWNQTIDWTKTFTTSPVVPSKTTDATNTWTAIATEAQVYKKQDALTTQTAYTSQWTSTKVPTITTNTLWQVTWITETNIAFPVTSVNWDTWDVTVQEELVSWTNIRTINGTSILWSWNIDTPTWIPDPTWEAGKFLTTDWSIVSWWTVSWWTDYSWVTKTISGWEVELWLRTIVNVPTSNFTLTAPATLKDWEEYAIRIISETSYTMTLWTWFTNPRNVNTTLSGNATDQYVFLAIWGELELQPLVDTWA